MKLHDNSQVFRRPMLEGAKYGSLAGLIATWSISTAIAASELELGLPISTFYAIIGMSLGSIDFIASAYLGFGLHLVTGTILGAIIGGIAVRVELRKNRRNIFSPYKSTLLGIGTGILVWLMLFLPITALIIQPSIGRITEILSETQESTVLSVFDINNLGQSLRGIATSAIALHIVWGAIFGFIISSLLRIRISNTLLSESSFVRQYRQFRGSPLRTLYFGLVMSIPFLVLRNIRGGAANKRTSFVEKYSSVYGLVFGFGLWLVVFLPITFIIVIPLLNSFEYQDIMIRQRVPTGEVASATFFGLLSMIDRIIYGALAFNIFYGLLTAIMLQSLSGRYPTADNKRERQNETNPIRGGENK